MTGTQFRRLCDAEMKPISLANRNPSPQGVMAMGKIVGTIRRLRNAAARRRFAGHRYRPLIASETLPADVARSVRYVG